MRKLLIMAMAILTLMLSGCDIISMVQSTTTKESITTTITEELTTSAAKTTTEKTTSITPTTKKPTTTIADEYKKLFKDSKYLDGFKLYYPSEANVQTHSGKLVTYYPESKNVWELAQWSCAYDFWDSEKDASFGQYSFIVNNGKNAAMKLIVDTTNASLRIVLNASEHYDHDRKAGEPWPSILVQQNFDDNLINISSMKEIKMNVSYKVNSCTDKTISKYDSSLHCAQMLWYITIQNRNQNSPDFGKYVWFGLNLFDSRMCGTISNEYGSQDGGKENNTGAFIFQPSSSKYMDSGKMASVGVKETISFDLLSYARIAYETAIERGYLGTTKFEELYIGSTNFGFEVPGTFDIDATIYNIQIEYKEK